MNTHPNYSEWTKEQKEEFAKERMTIMKEKNEKIKQRHAEVEADRIKAEKQNSSITSNRKLPCKKVTSKVTVQSEETGRKCQSTREWDLEKYGEKYWEPHCQPANKEYKSSHFERKNSSTAGHQFSANKVVTPENLNKSRRESFNNEKYGYNQHKNASRSYNHMGAETQRHNSVNNENCLKSRMYAEKNCRNDKRSSSKRRVNNWSYSCTSESDSGSHAKKSEITSLWKSNKYREQERKQLVVEKWITDVTISNEGNTNIILENTIVPEGNIIDLTDENDIDYSKNIDDYPLTITEENVPAKKKSYSKFDRFERSSESSYDDVACNTKPVMSEKELEVENEAFSKNDEYVEKKIESLHVNTQEYKEEDLKNSNENIVPKGNIIDLTTEDNIDDYSKNTNDYPLNIMQENIIVKKKNYSKFQRFDRTSDSSSHNNSTYKTKSVMHENKLDIGKQVFRESDEFLKKKNNSSQVHFDGFNKNISCIKQKRFENKGNKNERFILNKNKEVRSIVDSVNNSVVPKVNTIHRDSNYLESASNSHEDGIWSNTEQTDIKWKLSDDEYQDNKKITRKDKSEAKSKKDKVRRKSKMAKSEEKSETFSDGGWSTVSED